jgi:hypothetical protein
MPHASPRVLTVNPEWITVIGSESTKSLAPIAFGCRVAQNASWVARQITSAAEKYLGRNRIFRVCRATDTLLAFSRACGRCGRAIEDDRPDVRVKSKSRDGLTTCRGGDTRERLITEEKSAVCFVAKHRGDKS